VHGHRSFRAPLPFAEVLHRLVRMDAASDHDPGSDAGERPKRSHVYNACRFHVAVHVRILLA
jgi:hypothetical protein